MTAILAAAGATWKDVNRTTAFVGDINDFAAMNAEYAAAIGAATPARSTVQVAGLPRGGTWKSTPIALLPK
ncbi:MAG: Rid family hydrolase [bacterium]